MSHEPQRCYLVVVDDTPESRLALRYAARRARQTGGRLALLSVLPPSDFVQWGGVQEAIESETREAATTLLAGIAVEVTAAYGLTPTTAVRRGPATEEVLAAMSDAGSVSALVLGTAAKGAPGPLVSHFTGDRAGQLPCPLILVPGGMSEADIDRLA